MLLNFHLQQQKDAMKWIYYLVIYAVVDFPIYFADWNGPPPKNLYFSTAPVLVVIHFSISISFWKPGRLAWPHR